MALNLTILTFSQVPLSPAAWLAVAAAVILGLVVMMAVGGWRRRYIYKRMIETLEAMDRGGAARKLHLLEAGELGQIGRLIDSLSVVGAAEREHMRRQGSCLQALLAGLEQPVLVVNMEGNVELANPRATEILSVSPDSPNSVTGGFGELLRNSQIVELMQLAKSGHAPPVRQVRLNMLSGMRTMRVSIRPILEEKKITGLLLLLDDQTDFIQNTQIKADFAANASHELRTPLASIRAAVETINETGLEEAEIVRRCLSIIEGHVLRLQLLVQDLLDLSRTEDPRALIRTEEIDLEEVRPVILDMFGSLAADKNLALRFIIAPDARIMRGDERLIMLILKNLIDNSLKFTATGFVEVRWRRQMRATLLPAVPAENSLHSQPRLPGTVEVLVLEVQDTGCGIPVEDIHRVFERFYTVNRSRGGADRGTGLGLAIVKHAVAAMGGAVELDSQPGVGTTMRCLWPIAQSAVTKAGPT